MSVLDELDQLTSGGGKSLFTADSVPGETHSGKIVSLDVRQTTDFQTGQPQTWDDGTPKMQLVVSLQTDEHDNVDDDGLRACYIKLWGLQRTSLMDAVRAAGGRKASDVLTPGAVFQATFTGLGESKTRGFSAPKLYAYVITPAPVAGLDQHLAQPVSQPPVVQAPVAQPVFQQAIPSAGQYTTPAPVAQPVMQAPAQAGGDIGATVRVLIGQGASDAQIAAATGLPESAIPVMRATLA